MSTDRVEGLGHVGLRCFDVGAQASFYRDVLGLHLTDVDEDRGMYFLSGHPDVEHHELLLASGRSTPPGTELLQQLSFRCATLETVLALHRRLCDAGITIDATVTHGNAVSVYFFDPEGNHAEVYWPTGLAARQPFYKLLDFGDGPVAIMDQVRAVVARYGTVGFMGDFAAQPPPAR